MSGRQHVIRSRKHPVAGCGLQDASCSLQVAGSRLQDTAARLNGAGRGCWRIILALFLLLHGFMVNTSFGQRVSATLTKEKIVIGEQTILEINVEGVTADMIQIDFVFPDTANHLEVLDHKREPGGHSVLIYTATITSFDSGYWELPPMEMILTDQRKLSTERIGLSVVPVDVSHLVD
ncbi:MAG: hypothetical protein K0Q66_1347, partial [Chitinophagaceae bacterium]|nr:hypothetical protein [Chitinophagaceae bacterium]